MATKVIIALPTAREPKSGTLFDLARLVNVTKTNAPDIEIAFATGSHSLIHELRSNLVKDAVEHEADWILFIDDDMRFPPDALMRLLKHRRDIVGCNYVTRSIPPLPTARNMAPDAMRFYSVPTLSSDTDLAEVDAIGFGFVLINMRVFKDLPKPWFSMPWLPQMGYHVGEDVYFCVAASKHGFKTLIDHDLSKEIKHVGTFEFSWDHYEALASEQMIGNISNP